MSDEPRTRWQELSGRSDGGEYAAHFDRLAASGVDVHGEASFCDGLIRPGSRVLDAGCGTGRVACRLAQLGHAVVGTDVDASMLAVARAARTDVTWVSGDLADLSPSVGDGFDMVLMAGNVVPLVAEGTLDRVVGHLTRVLADDGLLVAGFGLDAAHLPPGCPVTTLEEYDDAVSAAGLRPVDRWGTWDRDPWDPEGGYVVAVHSR
jgi:ubiquinone/menaquinone biosynthesis C-methylase UbiE